MFSIDLDAAKARQEQYRKEADTRRLAPRRTTGTLAAIARLIRASFDGPTLVPGSVLPATH